MLNTGLVEPEFPAAEIRITAKDGNVVFDDGETGLRELGAVEERARYLRASKCPAVDQTSPKIQAPWIGGAIQQVEVQLRNEEARRRYRRYDQERIRRDVADEW